MLEQMAALLLLVGLLLLALLLLLLVGLLLLLLLQPARNAAVATHATASPLHCLAIIQAGCRIPVPAASPAPGEGHGPPQRGDGAVPTRHLWGKKGSPHLSNTLMPVV
jgi:hypothetical protein